VYLRVVVPLYPPLSLVGAWITTHEFMREMVRRGHEVKVTAYHARGSTHETFRHEGVVIEKHFRAVGHPDVIIGHAGDDGSAAAIAERCHVPLVAMVHGGDVHRVRRALRPAALAVFNSASFAETVAWPGDWIVAHPPIDPARYRTTPGDAVTLINLSAAKGGELFWRLAAAMPEQPFLGVLGGYGRQIMFSGYPNVTMQRLTLDMAGAVYGRTRVLLLPSQYETWGRVGLEAALSGIPTVARALSGIVEALGSAATYVQSDDVHDWVAALRAALVPAEWQRLSALARRRSRLFCSDDQLTAFAAEVEGLAHARQRIGA
jgi:hypothetical protein